MRFRRISMEDLKYILGWLEPTDYLRSGVLEHYVREGEAYTVDVEGKPVAVSIIHPVDREGAWLMGARVEQSHRGKGVGKYMTSSLVEEAYRRGFRWVALMTSARNEPVHRICRDLGMELKTTAVWVSMGSDKVSRLAIGGSYFELDNPREELVNQLYSVLRDKGVMVPVNIGMGIWGDLGLRSIEKMLEGWESICVPRNGIGGGVALVKSREDRYTWYMGSTVALIPHRTRGAIADLAKCIEERSSLNPFNEVEIIAFSNPGEDQEGLEGITDLAAEDPWKAHIFYKRLR